MATVCNFISAFLGLFLLTQCNTKQDSNSVTEAVKSSIKTQSANLLFGEWKFKGTIWYTSELTLQENGNFKFHDQGCLGQGYSEGNWVHNGTGIILTSFSEYSKDKPLEIIETKSENKPLTKKHKKRKGGIEYFIDPSIYNMTYKVKVKGGDTSNIYFDKVQFRLEGDTLYRLDNNGLKTDTKYIFSKNNR